ncbi:MAG: DUF898 domain-containing protein [Silicimonas sp.]|nr:DUF898 domain-containing protein [Silicimonas sp.]
MTLGPSTEQFVFKGNAREWFGIWIVNLLLSIVTLGIYSAWAKVRAKKYFYQNTYVADRNFDYHATGMQILIGRIIVVIGFVAYSVLSAIPVVGLVAVLALFAIIPWLLVRSLKFNAQMSSWSNVRFRFTGSVGKAAIVYLLYPVLTALTLYTTFPFFDRARKRFTMNNHWLGKSRFEFDAPIGGFYKAMIFALGWIVFVSVAVGIIAWPGLQAMAATEEPSPQFVIFIYVWIFLGFFPAATIYSAMVRNVTIGNLTLERGHQFHSDVIPGSLVFIAITNAVAVLCTLGLLLPWAHVRMHKYLTLHTHVDVNGSLDDFVGEMDQQAGAIGDAYSDIEGIDIGLPI